MAAGRVIVVAHDPQLVTNVASVLRAEAYNVRTSDGWEDAARQVTAFAPQVLVAGLAPRAVIPEDLCALRRALGVRLVIISAGNTARIQADAHLPSPIGARDLIAALERLCGRPPLFLLSGVERRSPARPKRGDVRPCPRCGYAQRFEEPTEAPPAWMCRNVACLNAEFVRA